MPTGTWADFFTGLGDFVIRVGWPALVLIGLWIVKEMVVKRAKK